MQNALLAMFCQVALGARLHGMLQKVVQVTTRNLIQRSGDAEVLMHPDAAMVADLTGFVAHLHIKPLLIIMITKIKRTLVLMMHRCRTCVKAGFQQVARWNFQSPRSWTTTPRSGCPLSSSACLTSLPSRIILRVSPRWTSCKEFTT